MSVYDFDGAEAFLKKGRDKNNRPLGKTRRVVRIDEDHIAFQLHHTMVIVWHRDGTATIRTGGWDTVTTKKDINGHSKASWYSGHLWHTSDEKSPAKIQKCRARGCKGTGLIPETCDGPGRCYGWGNCAHDAAPAPYGGKVEHMQEKCWHGETAAHTPPPSTCYRCNGSGMMDYGSKQIAFRWDGDPVHIDETGKVLGPGQSYTTYDTPKTFTSKGGWYGQAQPAKAKNVINGDVIMDKLNTALPGLSTELKCPACAIHYGAISRVVVALNDKHAWPREKIADWLETLDVDLTFPIPSEGR